ncbi:unnamed protein product [Cuscuta campestris]|uniref:ARID domain-containing protein n=1 Tax=Cuscuta campestris TaxID=132261 RepID=A0A484KPY5_9ASTE|nr:unnamed protein product [Cuscuta campestris]
MEKWSNLEDESTLHEVEIAHASNWGDEPSLRLGVKDWVFDGYKKKLRVLFDQILVVFLSNVSKNICLRPLPVMNGGGREMDLFKLYWIVRRTGGYDAVNRENLWGFVAEQCGFDFREIPFLKLIYIKYLNEFDQWMWKRCRDYSLERVESGLVRRLETLSSELKERFGNIRINDAKQNSGSVNQNNLGMNNDGEEDLIDVVIGSVYDHVESAEKLVVKSHDTKRFHINNTKQVVPKVESNNCCMDGNKENVVDEETVQKVLCSVPDYPQGRFVDYKKCCAKDDNTVVTSAKKLIDRVLNRMHDFPRKAINEKVTTEDVVNGVHTLKRKSVPSRFLEIIDWVTNAAKHSDSPEIGKIPECSRWRDHSLNELWVQFLLIREAMLNKKHFILSSEESSPQKKLKMHPSMYDDDIPNHLLTEKMGCRKRIFSLTKPDSCSSSYSCSATDNKVVSPQKTEACPNERIPSKSESSPTELNNSISREEPTSLLEVFIGPLYQAEVPEWTGVTSESDSKWLGTRMWPPEKTKSMIESNRIGKGRHGPCYCIFPLSVQCVRFHCAEKRHKLKLELGHLFYQWRFNCMGEEVSLSWTAEEEERFKNLMRLNAATPNKFWNIAAKSFPSKTKNMLVSYYFNVFLIKHRTYQNRVTPKDIDSDDDEKEFGSVGDPFGHEAIYVSGSRQPLCTESKRAACYR